MAVVEIDGLAPAHVVAPPSGAELAAALREAAAARQATILRGGGTKSGWGRVPARVDLVIETSRLNRVLAHRYGDLTVTVEAGARLTDVNRELAGHRQWLPLDSAFDEATIGGLIATNDSGPLRHRFGTPRDLLIGVTLALTDGRLVKAGGTVVKNVAGYDLGRLVSGSFGTLAAIETATFKLAPLPSASGTLGVLYTDADACARDAQVLAASQCELTTLDVQAAFDMAGRAEYRLLVRVASSPAATDTQLAAARTMARGDGDLIRDAAEADLWRDHVRAPWFGAGATIRLSWRPADLAKVLILIAGVGRAAGVPLVLTGRVSVGAGFLRIDGDARAQTLAIERLRAAPVVGHVVVLRAGPDVKRVVDVWGPAGDAARVMTALKQTLDPAGILNAGRGPV